MSLSLPHPNIVTADGVDPVGVQQNFERLSLTFGTGAVGIAGGVLDGTYPNPGLAATVAGNGLTETSDVLAVGAGTGVTVAADTVSVAYGTTSTTACVGNDTRLSDSRAPSGTAGGVLDGTYPNPGLAASVAGAGLTETSDVLAVGAGTGVTVAADSVSVAYGTTSTTACVGNDSRLSDSRAPNGAAGGVLSGTYPNPAFAATAWTAYTPAWSASTGNAPVIGTGTLVGAYQQVLKTVDFRIILTFGTTTTGGSVANTWFFTTPNTIGGVAGYGNYYPVGTGVAYDSAPSILTTACVASPRVATNTQVLLRYSTGDVVGWKTPFTWASGDQLMIQGSYEAA